MGQIRRLRWLRCVIVLGDVGLGDMFGISDSRVEACVLLTGTRAKLLRGGIVVLDIHSKQTCYNLP